MSAAPGWYDDPDGSGQLRYWDGRGWTEHVLDGAAAAGQTIQRPAAEVQLSPAPEDGDRSSPSGWRLVVGLLVVAVLAIWGFVGYQFFLSDGDDDSGGTTTTAVGDDLDAGEDDAEAADDAPGASGSAGELGSDPVGGVTASPTPTAEPVPSATLEPNPTPTVTPVPTTTPTPTAPVQSERTATLLVDVARLRTAPRLSADQVTSIDGLAGSQLTVIGDPVDGWYLVRIKGREGWMFGGFILPPAEGLTVVQTRDEQSVVLVDFAGRALGVENESGSYALVTDRSGDLWRVILPDGGTAFVEASAVRVRT